MSDVVMRVEGLKKYYKLGDVLTPPKFGGLNKFRRMVGYSPKVEQTIDPDSNDLWALDGVDFEISRGEVVGVIGRNGAGKSTLLKILARVTPPTSGQVSLRGRLAALLEVGTGFHAELTGLQNIYFNGSLYGLSRDEMARRVDQIIAFAEIERFIDTPVKFYSSGMYVRLAFSVAAHLDPEIMLIDEVLAVGDARFQKKCLSALGEAGEDGRTVIFVSHSMQAISRLCDRAILLESGKVVSDGPVKSTIAKYLESEAGKGGVFEWPDLSSAPGDDVVRLLSARSIDENNKTHTVFDITKPIGIEMVYHVFHSGIKLIPNIQVSTDTEVLVFGSGDHQSQWVTEGRPAGVYRSIVWMPGNFLNAGRLTISVVAATINPKIVHYFERDILNIEISDNADAPTRGAAGSVMPGVIRPLLNWDTDRIE